MSWAYSVCRYLHSDVVPNQTYMDLPLGSRGRKLRGPSVRRLSAWKHLLCSGTEHSPQLCSATAGTGDITTGPPGYRERHSTPGVLPNYTCRKTKSRCCSDTLHRYRCSRRHLRQSRYWGPPERKEHKDTLQMKAFMSSLNHRLPLLSD